MENAFAVADDAHVGPIGISHLQAPAGLNGSFVNSQVCSPCLR